MKQILVSLLFFEAFCFAVPVDQTLKELEVDEQSSQEVQEVLRKMDDDLKEGLVYFSGLLNGIFQIVDGKENAERTTIVNGVNQFIKSLVDILMIGQKRNHLNTITNEKELRQLVIWAIQTIQQQADQSLLS
jgi:hypothetical protein